MKSFAHNMALWLADQNVGAFGGSLDWSINVGNEPDVPDNAVTLYDTGGGPADTDQLNIRTPEMQVRVRSRAYPDGFSKIENIARLINAMPAQALDGMRLIGVSLVSDVAMIGADDKNRPIFTANFQATVKTT